MLKKIVLGSDIERRTQVDVDKCAGYRKYSSNSVRCGFRVVKLVE